MDDIKKQMLAQFDAVLDLLGSAESAYPQGRGAFDAAAMAAIERIAGPRSTYARQAQLKVEGSFGPGHHRHTPYLADIIKALRRDVEAGYLASVEELVHGQVFGDFLEQAEYLLGEGYKDAAAVIAGGVLEVHLRDLCTKSGIGLELQSGGKVTPKRAGRLNDDLAGADVYSKLDRTNVTAWLGLRNNAAHARYGEYTRDQVALMVQGIRDFITRNPA